MNREQIIRKRDRLLARLPQAGEILRGSLLERTIRHREGCPKCDRGEGHPAWILAVGYPGRLIRHISLRSDQAPQVRQWLDNFHKLKTALEEICELNQQLLRSDTDQRSQTEKTAKRRRARD